MRNTRRLCSFIFLACGSLIAMSSMANADEAVAIPIASASALEYHNASNWFWGLNQGVGLALPLLLLVTGWGARQYKFLKFLARIFRERRVLALASFAALYFLLDRSLRLPIAYTWDRAYGEASGRQSQALVPWLGNHVIESVLSVGGLILVVLFAYWLMEWSQRRWWLLSSAVVSIVVLAFLLVEPFTQSYKPLGNSPLELQIAELAARTGVPRSAIVVEHCDPVSSCPPGRVIGMGPTRLVLLNDALLLRNPESWTLQTVAHDQGALSPFRVGACRPLGDASRRTRHHCALVWSPRVRGFRAPRFVAASGLVVERSLRGGVATSQRLSSARRTRSGSLCPGVDSRQHYASPNDRQLVEPKGRRA